MYAMVIPDKFAIRSTKSKLRCKKVKVPCKISIKKLIENGTIINRRSKIL